MFGSLIRVSCPGVVAPRIQPVYWSCCVGAGLRAWIGDAKRIFAGGHHLGVWSGEVSSPSLKSVT